MVNENNSTKEKVLNVLKRNDGPVSGSDLSLLLKVSRTSVWKAVQSLQNSGYRIVAEKKGYRLEDVNADILCPLEFGIEKDRFIHFTETDSTMNEARKIALKSLEENDRQTRVVTADRQREGKGRGSHKWKTTQGSLAFTMVTFPEILSCEAGREVMASQIALVRTLTEISGRDFFVRWPNDVWSKDGKVAGILDEFLCTGSSCGFMNLGIGVNLSARPKIKGSDIILDSKPSFTRKEILSIFIRKFNSMQALVKKDSDDLHKMWSQLNYDADKKVSIMERGEFIFTGINSLGFAALKSTRDNSIQIFPQGSIKYEKH